ncbi:Sec-independent protein translocase protein TatB [Arenimonas composti]|uniref:Sec-independent protein translocase protein TatB n=1 Tax=Arenimonas composti TR7-09 = DSM 18010 TaxID=1121013 RepID=A0A091BCT6_9GAMM|nr:Sec-independent protein translocase protein TatB [Arenimonas composti]KFN49546.1 hypothetical protein P873_10355 [Arenimonas composti TR7-09 = DSM 18010]
MFDVGIFEMAVIAIVALIVLGPERLPKAARFAGLWVRRARAQWYSVKSEFEREMAADELRRSLLAQADEVRRDLDGVRTDIADAGREVAQAGQDLAAATRAGVDGATSAPAPDETPAPTGPAAADPAPPLPSDPSADPR